MAQKVLTLYSLSSRGNIDTSNTGRRLREDASLGRLDGANEFDVGFHAGADRLGFPGGRLNVFPGNGRPDPVNFPNTPNLNQGPYSRLETQLADLANTPGNRVNVDFRRIFNEGNLTQRPDYLVVRYQVNDGFEQVVNFRNRPGG